MKPPCQGRPLGKHCSWKGGHLPGLQATLYVVISINQKKKKKKKMPNQFSKNLVALPLASFLSLPASSSGHLLILNRTKQHNTSCSVFPLETFTSASGLAAGRGLPSPELCLTVFRTPEFLAFASWLPHGGDSVQSLIVPMDAFWGH